MIDSEIASNRCNHIWLCNRSPDGYTLQLQSGGRPSDVAQYILALLVVTDNSRGVVRPACEKFCEYCRWHHNVA